MTHKDNELREQIEDAIKDGLANHTGEWFNGFIAPGIRLNEKQSRDLLLYITKAKRLNDNLLALFTTTLQQREREAVAEGFNKAIELVEDITSDRNTEEQTIKNATRAIKNKKELRLVLGNILANDMYYSGQDFILKQLKKYIGTLDRSTNSNDTLSNVNNKENN